MKRITFTERKVEPLQIRNNTEFLIAQIVDATSEVNKKKLAKQLKLAYNILKWTDTDLSVLYGKRNDPKIRSYTGLVWSYTKVNGKKEHQKE